MSCNVPIRTDHMKRLAGCVPLDFRESPDAVNASVRPKHPKLGVELLLATQRKLDFFVPSLLVFGMNSGMPCLIVSAELLFCNPIETKHLIVPG